MLVGFSLQAGCLLGDSPPPPAVPWRVKEVVIKEMLPEDACQRLPELIEQ